MYVEVVTMTIPVYQKVSADRFCLPMAQADSVYELAEMLGVNQEYLYRAFRNVARRSGRRQKRGQYQITWIEVEE